MATVALPEVSSVAGTPFIISFATTLFIATPPETGTFPFSEITVITGLITIVSVTVAQVCGDNLSHN